MTRLIFLGSSNAIPTENHENTHMALVGEKTTLLIDCAGNPVLRLPQAGIGFDQISDLILTHFHPDHVTGVPLLLMNMWLMGRQHPLNIYGLPHTVDRMEILMDSYGWANWPNFFPVYFNRLPEEELTLVISHEEFRVFSSPVRHMIPTVGLRIEFAASGKKLAYSCDTEPCPEVVRLSSGTDVLVHEAAGASLGHSSAAQAGEIARQAEVNELYLIHYNTSNANINELIEEARENFQGKVGLASDFMELSF
jgi:ribonuclease Z